ncbi:unnamed protein product [Caenorhabditis nigoni]
MLSSVLGNGHIISSFLESSCQWKSKQNKRKRFKEKRVLCQIKLLPVMLQVLKQAALKIVSTYGLRGGGGGGRGMNSEVLVSIPMTQVLFIRHDDEEEEE